MTLLVERHRQRLEALLASSVPNLQVVRVAFIRLRVDVEGEVVETECRQVLIRECLAIVDVGERGFTDSTITDQQNVGFFLVCLHHFSIILIITNTTEPT